MDKNHTVAESRIWQLAFFTILLIFTFSTLYQTIYTIPYSATGLFFDFGSAVVNGNLPYRDFPLEYPPFSLLFFILPRLFAPDYLLFAVIYQAEVVIFVIIGLFVFYDTSRRLGRSPWKLMAVYTLGILAMGPITAQQFDIFPAIMVLLAIYFFWLDKHGAAWVFLVLGTMTKIYPAALVPLFLVFYIRNRQYQPMLRGILTFALVSLAILLPFLIISPTSLWSLYEYHAERGIQIETTYSSLLMLADKLGWTTARADFNFGAWNIQAGGAGIIAELSTFVLVAFLFVAYGYIYIRTRAGKVDIIRLGSYSLLIVLIVLITSKVLSPQYLIWLVPLLPLVAGKWRYVVWTTFVVIGGLTYLIFPFLYEQLINFDAKTVAVLGVRNILLVAMLVILVVSIRRINMFPLAAEKGDLGK